MNIHEFARTKDGKLIDITSFASTAKHSCHVCRHAIAAIMCSGCNKWYCDRHIGTHPPHGEWPQRERFVRSRMQQ